MMMGVIGLSQNMLQGVCDAAPEAVLYTTNLI